MTPSRHLVLFDFDYTLADSSEGIVARSTFAKLDEVVLLQSADGEFLEGLESCLDDFTLKDVSVGAHMVENPVSRCARDPLELNHNELSVWLESAVDRVGTTRVVPIPETEARTDDRVSLVSGKRRWAFWPGRSHRMAEASSLRGIPSRGLNTSAERLS